MPDIQAYLNTIYFIITEISTFDTFPISSLSDLINDQLQLLFSIYPYLLELLHDTIDTPSYPYILIYQYKFYKYLINYNLQFLQEQQQQYYSKIFLYFYQLKLLWDEITSTSTNTSTSTSGNNTNYLTIVLSIEETNMNPLYNPYQEMVYDLDYYGYYSCNISYYDHLQYWYNHIHTSSSSSSTNDIIPFDDILFEQIIPVNEIEKNLLQEIYQKFPKNLPERIQDGLQSIEKSLSYYDMVILLSLHSFMIPLSSFSPLPPSLLSTPLCSPDLVIKGL